MNVHGKLPLLIVLSHAPPATSDRRRTAYFKGLLARIPEVDPRQPDRKSIWLGDFNFEEELSESEERRWRQGAVAGY